DIRSEPELLRSYLAWNLSRTAFNEERWQPGSEAARQGWQKHYSRGLSVADHTDAAARPLVEHQKRLRLAPIIDERAASDGLAPSYAPVGTGCPYGKDDPQA